jgi:hypothetical protein
MTNHIIPFFVADRPASLLILKGVFLKYPSIKVGIMTHAFTSKNMWQMFKNFPYNVPLLYENKVLLKYDDLLAENLIKMTDSGVFSKNGCNIEYEELYERYNRMGTNFGIMIDVFRDARETIKSAEMALRIYEKNQKKYKFKLVAVAQGNTLGEYLECYEKLSRNFEFVAVGGLLKKLENSARFVRVRDEKFMYQVLSSIKKEFKPNWLFALGCYHPSRHKRFEEIGVWGSDYKGWIFNYKLKRQLIKSINEELFLFESKNGFKKELNKLIKLAEKVESNLLEVENKWRRTKDKNLKKLLRNKINQLKSEFEFINKEILKKRELLARKNHLPSDYKDKLAEFKGIVNQEEQFLRFKQVRKYIEINVYGQLQ